METFSDYAKQILARRKADGVRGASHEQNRFDTHLIEASFIDKPLDAISSREIRDWTRLMLQKRGKYEAEGHTLCTDTVKRSLSLVSAVFSAALEDEIVSVNPCVAVKIRKRADERATKDKWAALTLDEQKRIAACEDIPLCDRLAIRFAIATGLRQGEQYNLEKTDMFVGHDNPRVYVRYGSKGLPPKSGKPRTVPLFADGLVAAKRWLSELPFYAPSNPENLVFPARSGIRRSCGKPLGKGNLFRDHLKKVGITRRVRWHDLRHTFCTNLVTGALGQAFPLTYVQKLAGHSSVTITERYTHVGQSDLEKMGAGCSFTHDADPWDDFVAVAWDEAVDLEAVAS